MNFHPNHQSGSSPLQQKIEAGDPGIFELLDRRKKLLERMKNKKEKLTKQQQEFLIQEAELLLGEKKAEEVQADQDEKVMNLWGKVIEFSDDMRGDNKDTKAEN